MTTRRRTAGTATTRSTTSARRTTTRRRTAAAATLLPLALGLASTQVPSGNGPAGQPVAVVQPANCGAPGQPACPAVAPLLQKGRPVDWWFVFKLNSAKFPGCGGNATRTCTFGGEVQDYTHFSQQFVFASSESPALQQGNGCAGDTTDDPVGATFDEIYNNQSLHYVVWNDQFYDDPDIKGCSESCGAPWGHSKGIVAWNDAGDGLVMQVTTPSWPASGSAETPRKSDGNTLGCVKDNDVQVSQHFFALRLNKSDLLQVLQALGNASVVTDPTNRQIVNNGGPSDVQKLVTALGVKSKNATVLATRLSTGVQLISKPSSLHVPPWQMVSSILGGVPLRAATWWADPEISSTTSTTSIKCWSSTLSKPGAVEIATTGHWSGTEFGLAGGVGTNFNHAKFGVSTNTNDHLAIFGDMNQQGTLSGTNCASSQNGRGGTFYVVNDPQLWQGITALISGSTAPSQ